MISTTRFYIIREECRRAHPPPATLSRPLRVGHSESATPSAGRRRFSPARRPPGENRRRRHQLSSRGAERQSGAVEQQMRRGPRGYCAWRGRCRPPPGGGAVRRLTFLTCGAKCPGWGAQADGAAPRRFLVAAARRTGARWRGAVAAVSRRRRRDAPATQPSTLVAT